MKLRFAPILFLTFSFFCKQEVAPKVEKEECLPKKAEVGTDLISERIETQWSNRKNFRKTSDLIRYRTTEILYCFLPEKKTYRTYYENYSAEYPEKIFKENFAAIEFRFPLGDFEGVYGKTYFGTDSSIDLKLKSGIAKWTDDGDLSYYSSGKYSVRKDQIFIKFDKLYRNRKVYGEPTINDLTLFRCGKVQLCAENGLILHKIGKD